MLNFMKIILHIFLAGNRNSFDVTNKLIPKRLIFPAIFVAVMLIGTNKAQVILKNTSVFFPNR